MAREVVFMFEAHQPMRLRPYSMSCLASYIELGVEALYDRGLDEEVFKRAAVRCYIPALRVILDAVKTQGFKASFSISGLWLEQASKYSSEVVDLLRKVVEAGGAELVAQTYYHSVSPLLSDLEELSEQVEEGRELIEEEFSLKPRVAEVTEFIYNNDVGALLWRMGFDACLTEGVERVLAWRSPNYVYSAYSCPLKLLLRNYRLSDDVAFRFSSRSWDQYPLTASKYADWILKSPGDLVFIAMDLETFGEHQWPETGILEFLRWLPRELRARGVEALTPSDAIDRHEPVDVYDVPPWDTISWADVEKDVSAWLGSELQARALEAYERLGMYARAIGDPYTRHWRRFGVSDNFYYMSTKGGPSGEVHTYFSPFKSSLEAYTSYVSLLAILTAEVLEEYVSKVEKYSWRLRTTHRYSFKFRREGVLAEAKSLREVLKCLRSIDRKAVEAHLLRGDLQRWVREVVLWGRLADRIDEAVEARAEGCVEEVVKILEEASMS
ncbi:MAG: glycoside hydrolase family 57 protein [Candidatus Nezhaarchaeota archaeon]|nr:glycoside hydrolase family 57 protein [Candidatus Nezhaarchaeota archaeon]